MTDTPSTSRANNASASRLDMYLPIHKALRRILADTMVRIGSLDVDDPQDVATKLAQLDDLLDMCTLHVAQKTQFMHPAIEARQPGASQRIAAEHVELRSRIEALRDDASELRRATSMRHALGLRLYRHLCSFVAESLQHLHVEETVHNAALWAHYGDAELKAIHERLLASMPPDEVMRVLRWMLPALSPKERAVFLVDLRVMLQPEAFLTVLHAVGPHLDSTGWEKLLHALGVSAGTRAGFDIARAEA